MEALKALIEKVDDDYLTGLCNNGTVKRAYKDMEQEAPALVWQEKEAEVTLREERCRIRAPLGESSCSCPSRSICRHIITAILWLKRELGQEEEISDKAEEETGGQDAKEKRKQETADREPSFGEILSIPAEQLKRSCGSRGYRQFLAHIRAGELPAIEESSIVTVAIPWEKAVVKLLLPFEYSTCSCHSRELCSHKAQAVLAYQLRKNAVTVRELEALQEEEVSLDKEMTGKTCASVREMLGQQISAGLSRQSPEAEESLERLAVIAHRSGLPELENGLRFAASCYRQYFSRSAAFKREELLENMLAVYRRAKELEEAETKEELRRLAGTFRDTYEPVGNLHLVGMGGRSFSSKTGYAGEIYYFLETERKVWYTLTDVRPTIYEGAQKKMSAGSGNLPAPWDLNCSRQKLQKLEFELQNAMAASGGRLSVSQKSKGEAIGLRSFEREELRQMIKWDFEKLLWDCFGDREKNSSGKRREKLALVGAVRFEKTVFDTVTQRFSWGIYDHKGRKLFISLQYTKEEQLTIRLLERLEKRLREHPPEEIVFFGSLYMDEKGRLCLYPVEVFFDEDFGHKRLCLPEAETGKEGRSQEGRSFQERAAAVQTGIPSMEICVFMKQYLEEVEGCLLDVFTSGIASVQEETISELQILSGEGERLGLHRAGKLLAQMGELIRGKRHQMVFSPEPVILTMDGLDTYIQLCKEKLSRDMALIAMGDNDKGSL